MLTEQLYRKMITGTAQVGGTRTHEHIWYNENQLKIVSTPLSRSVGGLGSPTAFPAA